MVDKTLLERIRTANDIVDVIGSYLPLKRAGANWVALCPFHKEKSPSFNVNPHRQIFHCFGCQKGGDVFTFVREYENIGFMDAVRRLAERARIPLVFEQGPGAEAARHEKDILLKMHEQIAQRWQTALATDPGAQKARDYLKQRGVTDEAVKLFRIGYAPDTWDDTVNWSRSRNHAVEDVEKAGLIVRKEGTEHYYDRFRGRLMFPICDEQGRVIAFSGRQLDPDARTAKYVNSPETPIFTKSRVFFGLDKSRRAILDAGFAVVCEGQLDLIACYMAGVKNIVAPQGTAFTADHARILKRYASEAVLCFDSDEAGQNAAVRALDGLLESGLAIRVAVVPSPYDPDSFIKERGAEAFSTLIAGAPGYFDFLLDRLCRLHEVGSDRGRMSIVRELGEALQKTASPVIIDTHARKLAARLGVSIDSIQQEFRRLGHRERSAHAASETEIDESLSRPAPAELWLLRILLTRGDLIEWAATHLSPEWIRHPAARRIVEHLFARGLDETGVAGLVEDFPDGPSVALITEAAADDRSTPNAPQQLADIAVKLRNACLDRKLSDLLRRMEEPGATDARRVELLREQQALRTVRREPLSVLPP